MTSRNLAGRVLLLTGAGRGIGRAVALAAADAGAAALILAARSRPELEETAAACRSRGASVVVVPTDVSDERQVQSLVAAAIEVRGQIDVLVNSAGVYGPIGPTADVDSDSWTRAFAVNMFGPFYLCRHVSPHMMRRQEGKIILLAGGGATAPLPRFSSYASAKAGLVRLAETLAHELERYNVQVNAVAPGLVDTRLQDEVLAAGEQAGPMLDKIKDARERGTGAVAPEVAADLILFLASEDSGAISGKLISAPYDPWKEWEGRAAELNASPLYTLRRLDAFTIGQVESDPIRPL